MPCLQEAVKKIAKIMMLGQLGALCVGRDEEDCQMWLWAGVSANINTANKCKMTMLAATLCAAGVKKVAKTSFGLANTGVSATIHTADKCKKKMQIVILCAVCRKG